MNMERVEQYLAKRKEKDDLEEKTKSLGDEIKALESEILTEMCDNGLQSFKLNGQQVVLSRTLWSSLADETAIEALKNSALAPIVKETVNASSLSAAVREFPIGEDGFPILPEGLAGRIKVSEVFRLSVRKS